MSEKLAKKRWFVPLILFLLMIIAVPSLGILETDEQGSITTEQQLEEMCNLVRGVSNAKVMITYEAKAVSSFIGASGGEEKISGIAVVCDGGGEPAVQLALYEMLNALFGISSTRITVSERN